ncbi:MAG: nitroreductase family protein [Armatimonadetes bacterium]|nr:nitroreductase family protein [Armatimonadota bacterium]
MHGPHGLHRGRKFSSADLQILILTLLDKGPSYGYEIIKSLEELSDGYYAPSPGMIYPALTYLEEIGYADVAMEGTRKRYQITDEGRGHLEENRERADEIFSILEKIGARMEEARQAFEGELGPDEDEHSRQSEDLKAMRRRLRDFLRGYRPRGREDEMRLVGTLQQILHQIEHGKPEAPRPPMPPHHLMEIFERRRSMGLSRLKPDPVDRQLIEQMLQAANWAPSHGDTEPWRFVVFTGEGRGVLADLFELAQREAGQDPESGRKRAFASPVWIAIGMSPKLDENGNLVMSEREEIMAVASAVQNLHLMASELGLIGMWHSKGLSVDETVAKGLGFTAPARLLGFFMCGWPAVEIPKGDRGPWTNKVRWHE